MRGIVWGIGAFFAVMVLGIAVIMGLFFYYTKDLPRPERFTEASFSQPTKIYDRTGKVLLYEIYEKEKRDPVLLSETPKYLQQAVIATEDRRFYHHFGIDPTSIARAALANIRLRGPAQGGSTITQQLVRTSFLTREKTFERKIKEVVITLELERRYSKDEILGFYLNQVPLGANTYGVGAASQLYFRKKPGELTLAESATLAALIQAPSYYSPYGDRKDKLLARKNYVLDRMAQEEYIATNEAEDAKKAEIQFLSQEPSESIKAPHFIMYILDQLFDRYGEDFVRTNGLNVYTSLDWNLQKAAETAVQTYVERNKAYNAHNAALVAITPQTGEILAMVGSKSWDGDSYPKGCVPGKNCLFDPKVNIVNAYPGRQPGSAFKPFVYATAFERGAANDQTIIIDELTNFGVWGGKEYIPQNYDGKFRGPVTIRVALAQSLNIPAVKTLLEYAGIQESIETAKKMGVTTLNRDLSFYGPALVLGGGEVRLLDITSAYGVFATEGRRVPPVSIIRIKDSEGDTIEENKKIPATVLSPDVARLITDILSDNDARAPIFGARSPLYIEGYRVAAKTGTTQDYKDAWAIGYTDKIVAGAWVGNNNNDYMERGPGVELAAPIWNYFMRNALPYLSSPAQ